MLELDLDERPDGRTILAKVGATMTTCNLDAIFIDLPNHRYL